MRDEQFSLHRERPGMSEDKMVSMGTKADMLEQLTHIPASQRSQYFMLQGRMKWSLAEAEALKNIK